MIYFDYSYDPSVIRISSQDITRSMGYPDAVVPDYLEKQIEDTLAGLLDLVDLKGGFAIYDTVTIKTTSLVIKNKEFKTKSIITRSLDKSTSMAIFVCTIGQAVSKWAGELIKDDSVKGYIADVSASVITEKLAEIIHKKIGVYADQEMAAKISNRYSPGYCGWSVSDQHSLFSLLPADFCGISLNDAALMHPVKSVSGIIGIGSAMAEEPYACNKCDRKDCIMKPIR
jgi:hypothetical protein